MIITLLTDFGLSDHYVAAMKGVILNIRPDVQLIDISHDVAPYSIPEAAYSLAQAWHCFPAGTIHLVVVDPGVGSSRRPLLAEAEGHYFIAPDNGVLTMALAHSAAVTIRHIAAPRFYRETVSETFHGRDLFAPVAAHLARGVAPTAFGKLVTDYVRLPLALRSEAGAGHWTGTVLKVDRFGNIITSFESAQFPFVGQQAFELRLGTHLVTTFHPNYEAGGSGELFVLRGSGGFLEVSRKQASAAGLTGAVPGMEIAIRRV